MGLTLTQRKALAIVPKCTGLLSMIGSGIIIFDVLRTPKKRKQTYSELCWQCLALISLLRSCMHYQRGQYQLIQVYYMPLVLLERVHFKDSSSSYH